MSLDGKRNDKRVGRKPVHQRKTESKGSAKDYTLTQAFDMFYQAKSGERLRELTLRDYRKHFRYLMDWLITYHPEIQFLAQVTPQIIREYIYYLSYEKPLFAGHPYRSVGGQTRNGLSPGAVKSSLMDLLCFEHRIIYPY